MKGKKKLLKKVVLSFAIALITLIGVANKEAAAAGEAWDTPAQVKTPAGNLETSYYILSAEYSYGTYTSEKTTTFTKVTEDEINANKEHLDGYLYFDATTATMTVYGDIAGGSDVTYFDVQNGKLTISGSGSLMFDTTESVFINTVGSAAIVTKDFTGDFDISSTSVRKAIDDYDYIDITTTGDVRIVGGAKVALSETTNFIISAQNVNLELDDCNYFSGCKNITAKEKFTISTGYGFEGDSSKGNNVYSAKDIDIINTGSPVLFRNGDEFKATNKFSLSTNHYDIAVKSIKIDCGSGTIEYTGAEKSDKNIFNCDTAIKSDGDFTVESIGGFVGYSYPFSLEAGGDVKITASGNAPLISSQTTIDATGNLDIIGEYIISAQSSIGGEASLKANNITIANNYSDSIPVFGSNVKLEAKGDIEITNNKSNILGTGCTFKITKAKNVTINSAADANIFCGLVEMHATGDLNIINKIDSAKEAPGTVFDMETLLYVDGDVVIKTNNNQLICDTNLLIQGESEALGLGKDGKPGAKSVYFETAEGSVPMMCPGNIYVRGDFTAKKVDTKTLKISSTNPMFASEAKIHADGDILIESQWHFLNSNPLVIDKFSTEKSESNNVTINTNGNGNEVQFAYRDLTIECDGSLKITHQPGGLTNTNIDLKAKDIAISTGASHCENKMSEGEDAILASLSGNVKMRAEGDIIIDAPTAEAYEDGNGTVDIESETTVAKQNYAGGTHIYNCHHARTEYRDAEEAAPGEPAYTGDLYCADCGEFMEKGKIEPAGSGSLKGVCMVPDPEGEGALIGLEVSSETDKDLSVEILILDCTLLAKDEDAWIYTTGKCGIENNCLWTRQHIDYGYYWVLYRIYDRNGEIIDEQCYGFQNIW